MAVNEIEDGVVYPCQPIGCDAGRHLPGCVFDIHECLSLACFEPAECENCGCCAEHCPCRAGE